MRLLPCKRCPMLRSLRLFAQATMMLLQLLTHTNLPGSLPTIYLTLHLPTLIFCSVSPLVSSSSSALGVTTLTDYAVLTEAASLLAADAPCNRLAAGSDSCGCLACSAAALHIMCSRRSGQKPGAAPRPPRYKAMDNGMQLQCAAAAQQQHSNCRCFEVVGPACLHGSSVGQPCSPV